MTTKKKPTKRASTLAAPHLRAELPTPPPPYAGE